MSDGRFECRRNTADAAAIGAHLRACNAAFVPPLSQRVNIEDYAAKLSRLSERFEAWSCDRLAGLVAAYCNNAEGAVAFVSSVSVLPAHQGQGIALRLLQDCICAAAELGLSTIELEVDESNVAALRLYQKLGFSVAGTAGRALTLRLNL